MTQIDVHASRHYTVKIGSGLLHQIGDTVRALTKANTVCIVSDDQVWPLYGDTVSRSLEMAGLTVHVFQFPAGENSKNAENYISLLNFLAQNHLTRSDLLIALGGGVAGDLCGFAAATYLRGIAYIQVPTSLLAMVDSSVGGKTGIDLPSGKNLCGAFYQPVAVLCDTDTLVTLHEDFFRDGCAEVIKYAVLFDSELFAMLEKQESAFDREAVISRCIELKRDVVEQDEQDTGRRMLLNLGHTIGHAIESCSAYTVSHGKAVAIGMAMVCRAAKCKDTARITSLLQSFRLPTHTSYTADELYAAALADKKRSSDGVNLIVPKGIGQCSIVPTPIEALKTFIEEGM